MLLSCWGHWGGVGVVHLDIKDRVDSIGIPLSPDLVSSLMPRFLFRIQNDSTVYSASVIEDEISLGRGKILKDSEISRGEWKRWKQRVTYLSEGSLKVNE